MVTIAWVKMLIHFPDWMSGLRPARSRFQERFEIRTFPCIQNWKATPRLGETRKPAAINRIIVIIIIVKRQRQRRRNRRRFEHRDFRVTIRSMRLFHPNMEAPGNMGAGEPDDSNAPTMWPPAQCPLQFRISCPLYRSSRHLPVMAVPKPTLLPRTAAEACSRSFPKSVWFMLILLL